jgi:methionine-rich copper-binding protein CopC
MRSVSRRLLLVLGSVALLAGSVVIAAPAGAHDELVSSTPAAGDELATMPDTVELAFNGRPLEIGATVIVADAEGQDWAEGTPQVTDSLVSATLRPGAPDGFYQVRWRIVSEDGAVVSGYFGFAVGDTTDATPIPVPRSNDAAAQRPPSGDAAGDFEITEAAPPSEGTGAAALRLLRLVGVASLGALAALGAAAIIAALVARRPARRSPDSPNESLEGT